MCSVDPSMGTISGATHIKTTSSFSPETGKNFICNALCSSDEPVTYLIHIFQFFTLNNVFYKTPKEKVQRNQIRRTRGPGNGYPLLIHGYITQSGVLHHSQKSVTSHRRFFREERPGNFAFRHSAPHSDLR